MGSLVYVYCFRHLHRKSLLFLIIELPVLFSFLFGFLDVTPIIFKKPGLTCTAPVNNGWRITELSVMLIWPVFIMVTSPVIYARFHAI
ncbi:MAG: hypothetical protein P4L38_08495 [Syntrophaceae bacterium]|nr:hypothetical protein [Syntrophaceae bacterium]